MWVNVKIREKKKRKASFMEIVKTFQRKTTLHLLTLYSIPITPVSSKRSPVQLNNTLKTNIVATQTFDDDQAPLFSWINITKINDEIEHPQVAKNNLFIMEYNQSLVK